MVNMFWKKRGWTSPPQWGDLHKDILTEIFVRVPLEDRVGYVSSVCKNWSECLSDPLCWPEIDIQDWCRRKIRSTEDVDWVAHKLMILNPHSFRLLSAYKLGIQGFYLAANWGQNLNVLKIPMCEVTDKVVEKQAHLLMNLRVLDISCCLNITSKGIGEFGKKCKSLIELKRNMPLPLDTDRKVDDSEAMAIANTMPSLKKLETCYGSFGELGLEAILSKCKDLSHLNILGTWNLMKLDGDLLHKCLKLKFFRDAVFDNYEDVIYYSDEDDDDDDEDEDMDSDQSLSLFYQ